MEIEKELEEAQRARDYWKKEHEAQFKRAEAAYAKIDTAIMQAEQRKVSLVEETRAHSATIKELEATRAKLSERDRTYDALGKRYSDTLSIADSSNNTIKKLIDDIVFYESKLEQIRDLLPEPKTK